MQTAPDELSIFTETIQRLITTNNVNEILLYIIAALKTAVGVDIVVVWLIKDEKLVPFSQYGTEEQFFENLEIPADQTARILLELESDSVFPDWTFSVSDINDKLGQISPRWYEINKSMGAKSKMIRRLFANKRTYGLIEVLQVQTKRDWSQFDGALFYSMCHLISAVLMRSYQQSVK